MVSLRWIGLGKMANMMWFVCSHHGLQRNLTTSRWWIRRKALYLISSWAARATIASTQIPSCSSAASASRRATARRSAKCTTGHSTRLGHMRSRCTWRRLVARHAQDLDLDLDLDAYVDLAIRSCGEAKLKIRSCRMDICTCTCNIYNVNYNINNYN